MQPEPGVRDDEGHPEERHRLETMANGGGGTEGTWSRTHIVHREQEVERREGEGRRVEIGSDRRIEVTGVGDDGRDRAQIRQIVGAADAGETTRERAEIAPRRARLERD